jgi:hypothetical protein
MKNGMKGLAVAGVLALAGCGGGGSSPTNPPPATLLSVGGAYTVAVALGDNTCGSVTVQPQPTGVTHTPGASRFSLQHGPTTFQGAVATDGSFVGDPLAVADGSTALTLNIQGRFTTTGLTATVTVDENRPAPTADCRYLVQWTGTKQGAANVIP